MNRELNPGSRTAADTLFWYTAACSWPDRVRLLYYWLSPHILGHRAGHPRPVRTKFLNCRSIYLRKASTDVRVLRDIFGRNVYHLPRHVTGEVSSIVDLGAYNGTSALYFLERYPDVSLVAVEPDDSNFACLLWNIQSIKGNHRVRPIKACVADRRGTVRFNAHGPEWGRSIINDGEPGVEVTSMTMIDLLQESGWENIDLLKIDVEGAERYVFSNYEQWADRVEWIIMEAHLSSMDLTDFWHRINRSDRKVYYKPATPLSSWLELRPELCAKISAGMDAVILTISTKGYAGRIGKAFN